jgi:putative ABC transport system permease protein
VEGNTLVVIGVMPPGFDYPSPSSELWLPLGLDPNRIAGWFLRGIARLKPDVTAAAAQQELTEILWSAAREKPIYGGRSEPPKPGLKLGTLVTPLKDAITGSSARPLLVIQGAMLLILLIACANVATLLLGRAAARSREIALRHALGATVRRVVAQLLTESLVLSLASAAAGFALAWVGVSALGRLPLSGVPRIEHVSIGGGTLAFTTALALVTGLLFGLAPAWRSRSLLLAGALAEGSRGNAQSARRQFSALVIAQFALSLVLLIGSGLLLRSFRQMTAVDPGFRPAGVVAFQLPLPAMKYDGARATVFHAALLDSVRAMPRVMAAAVVAKLPFTGNFNSDGYIVEGHAPPPAVGSEGQVTQETVSPGYFRTLTMPMVRGRDFDGTDRDGSLPVVIVDETLARRFWPDGDAIGKRIETTGDRVWLTIVGVVGAVHDQTLTDAPTPHMYTPEGQPGASVRYLLAQVPDDGGDLARRLRRVVAALDPDVPVPDPHTMSYYVGSTLDSRRLTNDLLTAFAILAVFLASVGIYSVMSLNVRRRAREFAIRLAVGARPDTLIGSVLRQGLGLAAAGAVTGILGALAVTRYLQTMLYEVSPTDPTVFLLLPILLLAIGLVACWLPAWRAGKSDPLVALREE